MDNNIINLEIALKMMGDTIDFYNDGGNEIMNGYYNGVEKEVLDTYNNAIESIEKRYQVVMKFINAIKEEEI